MSFAATAFEFKHRFWLIGAVIFVSFFCYQLDRVNIAAALAAKILGPGVPVNSPRFDRVELAILASGAAIIALGALLRSWAEAYLHSSIVHDAAIHSDQLVAEGPYRHVRNPLYLGNDLLALGLGLLASRLGFAVMVVGMFLVTYRLILREEAGLLASQGESYRRYFNAVPRLWPSLRPRIPSSGARPNWRDGFTGEIFMWSIALAMAAFVATQRIVIFWAVMAAGFAIYFLQAYLRKSRATSQ
ncbi:MAG: methyltransferase [Candidatus Acidiferrales bacterium]